jgi:hypothetical protein
MKMRLFCLSLLLCFCLYSSAFADSPKFSYMRVLVVNTITEPVMVITDETGKQDQVSMLSGLTLSKEKTLANLSENEETVVAKLNELGKKGWELFSVETTGSITYYTLKKPLP